MVAVVLVSEEPMVAVETPGCVIIPVDKPPVGANDKVFAVLVCEILLVVLFTTDKLPAKLVIGVANINLELVPLSIMLELEPETFILEKRLVVAKTIKGKT
jgi:hypothetical protein